MYYVYIVKCNDDSLYCGITVDLDRRIKDHNESSKGAKYTRFRRPVILVWSKLVGNRSEASKEECRIKKLSRLEKLKLINSEASG